MATEYTVNASAMAIILAPFPPFAFGLVLGRVKSITIVSAQSQTHVVMFAKQTGFAQAQCTIA